MRFHEFASWSAGSLSTLAGLAQPEDWTYRNTTSDRDLPILYGYMVHTFRRVHQQGRVTVVEADAGRFACFNTGLLTPHFERIFGHFVEQTRPEYPQPWFLEGFFRESDHRLMKFQRLPDRASYFDEPADLLYDPRLDFRVQYEHIVNDHVERFPSRLQSDERSRTEAVRQAVRHAQFRVEQNYKTAIPQYYWPAYEDVGKLQLLLPLSLEDLGRADLALSIDRVGDVYRAATVLTLDMAYNNARLIARPDREWLEPLVRPGAAPSTAGDAEDSAEGQRASVIAEVPSPES
ncbi:MAG: DUF3825 domain-containing protein [Chloroflexota bacterium]|nr:DUF3825 domain-containing protein [Chloroflexota bacterium]